MTPDPIYVDYTYREFCDERRWSAATLRPGTTSFMLGHVARAARLMSRAMGLVERWAARPARLSGEPDRLVLR